jgi:superfamily II DNA or RNA helicase
MVLLVPRALPEGLYEHVVTEALGQSLDALEPGLAGEVRGLDKADAHVALARHVGRQVERALAAIPSGERPARQVEIANAVLQRLVALVPGLDESRAADAVRPPGQQLLGVHRTAPPARPSTPLSSSTLLTRAPTEPSLGQELAREIASSDEVDALIAFVTLGGVRAVRDHLEEFARRGGRLRLLTSVFSGTTEVKAVEWLARLPGAEVRVSYDTRRTRLHAKAWLFRRSTGLHTGYIGSANLTATALGSGQEWMVKICAADLGHVVEQFVGTFDTLWNDPELQEFDPEHDEHRRRLRDALGRERSSDATAAVLFDLRPLPFQEEILERLEVERRLHSRWRNLIVAATGTGKTVIAAFDYRRQADRLGVAPRLLVLAHRRELLEQARATFRNVLQDGAFGELLVDGHEPSRWEHVFASVQSAVSRDLLGRFGDQHFRYVVVDECHHAPADSYQAIVPALRPEILLGLTATPERTDGKSLLPDFDGHVAAELRLRQALDRQLLVPFEYYGVSDNTDLRHLRWSRSGYDAAALSQLYTGNDARLDLMVGQLEKRVSDVRRLRALAFCVSVEHAEFVARGLTQRGIPALAIHGQSADDLRSDAPRRLREREVNVLSTCDLYNEGVDLPFADALLLLRPTSSVTLFLQQLGRGLRHHPGKDSCLILDFVGRHRAEFRYDALLAGMIGVARAEIRRAAEDGFPYLPSGCVLQLDRVAREQVLQLIAAGGGAKRLAGELAELSTAWQRKPTLGEFLDATGRELSEVYAAGGYTTLSSRAGLETDHDEEVEDLSRRLGWLLHIDEPTRLQGLCDAISRAASAEPQPRSPADERRLLMTEFQLHHRGVLRTAEELTRYLSRSASVRDEVVQLAKVLDERVPSANDVYAVPGWTLALHRHYGRREILAAVGYVKSGEKGSTPQAGILKLPGEQRELLFVTLDKSGRDFSPTTRYRDYAISRELFHWETQSIASVSSESGRRYLESPDNGWSFYLFVRTRPDAPYAFLGPVRRVQHSGDRPIAITWRLEHPLPAALFERFATLATS